MTEPMDRISTVPKEATENTRAANTELLNILPLQDIRDFEEAKRGFIAPLPGGGVIMNEHGRPVWDMSRFSFICGRKTCQKRLFMVFQYPLPSSVAI